MLSDRSLPPTLLVLVVALIWALAPVTRAQDEPQMPMASLPLEEILRLYKENEDARKQEKIEPPFEASIHRMELTGRLLDETLELRGEFEVVVLAEDQWVTVPLLKLNASTTLSSLPRLDHAVLAAEGNQLSLVTRRAGTYTFALVFLERARAQGRERRVTVEYGKATLARMLVQVDEGLFRLDNAASLAQGDGKLIYPENGRFNIVWQRVKEARVQAKEVTRPPIESVITFAHGSLVSTLEGKAIIRLLYQLRFEGSQSIIVDLPEGPSLERVYLNRVPVPFTLEEKKLVLQVAPRRDGDQTARFELVLESDQGGYNLSGDLFYRLPELSWPTNELYFDVHLPDVFNYTWTGGSLSPVATSPAATPPTATPPTATPPAVAYTYDIPQPGKELAFHQYLISKSSATLRVNYAIDLTEKYFCQR